MIVENYVAALWAWLCDAGCMTALVEISRVRDGENSNVEKFCAGISVAGSEFNFVISKKEYHQEEKRISKVKRQKVKIPRISFGVILCVRYSGNIFKSISR